MTLHKSTVVIHSGGMDSSLCLAYAVKKWGKENVLSLSFSYGQRHTVELQCAQSICDHWGVDHTTLDISCLSQITENSLTRHSLPITSGHDGPPNSLVIGRNGLMARIGAIHAHQLGARSISMGIIEVESANSGYRDCSRSYMNLMQEILRIDLDDPTFEIVTPVVSMTKCQTLEFGLELGVLPFLLENTITCYQGLPRTGCRECPACQLRNQGIMEFLEKHPDFEFAYRGDLD